MKPCELCKDTGKRPVIDLWFAEPGAEKATRYPCSCRRGPLTPEEVLDGIAFRALTVQQLVDRIVADFMFPNDVELPRHMVIYPSRERVLLYIGRLVEVYGSKLGGLTRTKLASKVMKRLESRQRKQANADWAKYYGRP